MISAVLDANVVISGTIAPHGFSARILDAWRSEYIDVVTCPALIREIDEKLRLPRIRKKYAITDDVIADLLLQFSEAARLVPGLRQVDVPLPDPDDAMLFSAALESAADYIVTGDKPLLAFDWKAGCPIVSPRQFWEVALSRGPDST
jgi:putative PIN family toxin of toxin-antitoxin system